MGNCIQMNFFITQWQRCKKKRKKTCWIHPALGCSSASPERFFFFQAFHFFHLHTGYSSRIHSCRPPVLSACDETWSDPPRSQISVSAWQLLLTSDIFSLAVRTFRRWIGTKPAETTPTRGCLLVMLSHSSAAVILSQVGARRRKKKKRERSRPRNTDALQRDS